MDLCLLLPRRHADVWSVEFEAFDEARPLRGFLERKTTDSTLPSKNAAEASTLLFREPLGTTSCHTADFRCGLRSWRTATTCGVWRVSSGRPDTPSRSSAPEERRW